MGDTMKETITVALVLLISFLFVVGGFVVGQDLKQDRLNKQTINEQQKEVS